MNVLSLDLHVHVGTSFQKKLEFSQNDSPTNLSDRTFKAQVRKTSGGPLVAQFTFDVADQTTAPGVVYMKLSGQQTAKIKTDRSASGEALATPYIYDVVEIFTDQTPQVVIKGKLFASPRVTI